MRKAGRAAALVANGRWGAVPRLGGGALPSIIISTMEAKDTTPASSNEFDFRRMSSHNKLLILLACLEPFIRYGVGSHSVFGGHESFDYC